MSRHRHWRIQESFFLGGGSFFSKGPKPRYPKTKNCTDLGHYFLEGPKFTFENMPDLPPARGVPPPQKKIIENMTKVDIFDIKYNVRFLCIKVGFASILNAQVSNFGNILGFRGKFCNFEPQKR